MENEFNQVAEFHKAFGHPVEPIPHLLSKERVTARASWLREEVDEFCEATSVDAQADAMIDLMYFALGTLVEMGVKPSPLFKIVHQANMAKLWEDMKPRYNTQGKVIKPPTWTDPKPRLVEELNRQLTAV